MGDSLLPYLAMKMHPMVDSTSWDRLVVVGHHDRSSSVISTREKTDKPFNWMRPTAKMSGRDLRIQCFPGSDHIEHYAAMFAAYLRITRNDGDAAAARVGFAPAEEGATIKALKEQTNILDMPPADIVVTGLVHRLGSLTQGGAWSGAAGDEFAWTVKQIGGHGGPTVAFLGCRLSFWGSIAGDLVRVLARQCNPKEIIYFGKLGTTNPAIAPNRYLASGDFSDVHGTPVRWRNILDDVLASSSAPVLIGKHETLPSVLFETKDWLKTAVSNDHMFVDPEVGCMALAAKQCDVGFGYLHLISDNVASKYSEDLSNEREAGVLVGRDVLYAKVNEILGEYLDSRS